MTSRTMCLVDLHCHCHENVSFQTPSNKKITFPPVSGCYSNKTTNPSLLLKPTMSPATSDDIDVKEDLLNNRILRYFNLPPYLSDPPSPPSPPNSPPSTSTPTLTIHRTGQTYALSPLSAEETGLELIPASEARQFTNKDVIIYLDAVAQTKVLFHELWKLWYPLRRGEVWEESGLLERYV